MTTDADPIRSLDPEAIRGRLRRVRERTLELVSVLDWETLRRQHTPILSPMIWDLGHVAHFEESWLVRELAGLAPIDAEAGRLFDPVLQPRSTRERLPLPSGEALLDYLERVRERTLTVLDDGIAGRGGAELLADGFVYEMVAEHEEQHQETLLQAMQVLERPGYAPPRRREPPPGRPGAAGMARIPGGPFRMGWEGAGFAYDNEKPRHEAEVAEFWIDRFPVSQGEYLEFVEDGGYRRPDPWSAAGRAWLAESGAEAPANWFREGGQWRARFMDRSGPLPREAPVVHVGHHEAEAYARWAGKRLPTEAEWEKAALWDPVAGAARRWPWGDEPPGPERANLDQLVFAPAARGAYPEGASAYGVEQLLGDVWEWTASDFRPYPDFRAFPYEEYSEVFFGDEYKVLRGGSWATRPAVARGTFRNWDYPNRRQIFAGFRCARDG